MKQLDELMQKELTRKEFLTLIGAGLVSAVGFSQVIKSLLSHGSTNQSAVQEFGYGSTPYGGAKQ